MSCKTPIFHNTKMDCKGMQTPRPKRKITKYLGYRCSIRTVSFMLSPQNYLEKEKNNMMEQIKTSVCSFLSKKGETKPPDVDMFNLHDK